MNKISDEDIQRKKAKYLKHAEKFTRNGFTWTIAYELIPITQLRVWDMFALFQLAKRIPDRGTYLELGAKWGGSLRCVLYAAKHMGRRVTVSAIEPIPNQKFKAFCRKREIRYIKGYSENVYWMIPDASVDMLFIDGPHAYGQVLGDLRDYWPKVKTPGLVAGHDHEPRFPGVVKAVKEFFGEDCEVMPHSSIWVKEKDEALQRLRAPGQAKAHSSFCVPQPGE